MENNEVLEVVEIEELLSTDELIAEGLPGASGSCRASGH